MEKSDRLLAWQSPVNSTDKIKVPVLLYHGARDEIIRKSQSDRFAAACYSSGVQVEYLVSEKEGHGFSDPLDEQAVYIAIERFLAKHLGGMQQTDVPLAVEERLTALRSAAVVPF